MDATIENKTLLPQTVIKIRPTVNFALVLGGEQLICIRKA